MNIKFAVLLTTVLHPSWSYFDNDTTMLCSGKQYKNVTLAAYYQVYEDDDYTHPYTDCKGKKLRSLQDYLDDQCEFVTMAMDEKLGIPYGTKVCIPELNKHFGHQLQFEVRDTGSNLLGMSYLRADIFVRSETDSYDLAVNRKATLVFNI